MLKVFLKFTFIFFSKIFIPLFYKKKYLEGRWFENCTTGWIWAWRGVIFQKILRINGHVPWVASERTLIGNWKKIIFNAQNIDNFQSPGCYFQAEDAVISIGFGSYIAPNVGIITANHDPLNLDSHLPSMPVTIGEHCWIGMNSVILPGVTLGPRTIVGAGSIVTHSYPDGWIIIAGNPAKPIRKIDPLG